MKALRWIVCGILALFLCYATFAFISGDDDMKAWRWWGRLLYLVFAVGTQDAMVHLWDEWRKGKREAK